MISCQSSPCLPTCRPGLPEGFWVTRLGFSFYQARSGLYNILGYSIVLAAIWIIQLSGIFLDYRTKEVYCADPGHGRTGATRPHTNLYLELLSPRVSSLPGIVQHFGLWPRLGPSRRGASHSMVPHAARIVPCWAVGQVKVC